MSKIEILLLALGLAADAFAVSLCKGLSAGRIRPAQALSCGVYFGAFQALMPVIGYLLGVRFRSVIEAVDHWIAFALLGCIGVNMLREAFGPHEDGPDASFAFGDMLLLAIATSIDALAVGVTFAFLDAAILPAAAAIGVITFCLSTLGAKLGSLSGMGSRTPAEAVGGAILVLMGTKILLEHTIF